MLNWLYCYSCLFDRTLAKMKYSFECEWARCPVCGRTITAEFLYRLMLKGGSKS